MSAMDAVRRALSSADAQIEASGVSPIERTAAMLLDAAQEAPPLAETAPGKTTTQPAEGNATADDAATAFHETVERLAALPRAEYELSRRAEAKRLDCRLAYLDCEVAKLREDSPQAATDGIEFDDVKPCPDPVPGDALLSDIVSMIRRFIACELETARAAALWIVMTWFIDVVQIAPLAIITAPEKRCGKTLLLTLLSKLSCRPMVASNISPAALFRVVEAWKPTLMIDEADAFMRDNEE